jgi:hypothetical protein
VIDKLQTQNDRKNQIGTDGKERHLMKTKIRYPGVSKLKVVDSNEASL